MSLRKEFEAGLGKSMTDKEKLVALLTEFGVGFTAESDGAIYCKSDSAKVTGYCFFFTVFEFDRQGRFIQMGAWE